MHKNFFDQTATALQKMGYPALSTPLVDGNDICQLTVSLPQAQSLQIVGFFLSDLLRLGSGEDEVSTADASSMEDGIDFLQLFIRFPFDFSEENSSDLARLMMMINWTTPVGAFGINEPQKIIYYRQVLEWHDHQTDPGPVLDVVNAMEYYTAFRYKRIQEFAAGEMTITKFLQELRDTSTLNEEFPGYDLRN